MARTATRSSSTARSADNSGGSAGAGVCFSQSKAVLSNSIVWENLPSEIRVFGSGRIRSGVSYSDVAGGWTGAGNLDADPGFARPGYWSDPANARQVVSAADPLAIWRGGDYHLLSQAGRWDPVAKAWVKDVVTSPCIGAGDLASDYSLEPQPNGGRINLGVYGGTNQASLSDK